MPKHLVNTHGQPINSAPTPRWMRHHTPSHPPDRPDTGYIIRMRLTNGYWAYRPDRLADLAAQFDWHHPNSGGPWRDLTLPQRKIPLREGAYLWAGVGPARSGEAEGTKKGRMMRRLERTVMSRVRDGGVKWGLDAQGRWVLEMERDRRGRDAAWKEEEGDGKEREKEEVLLKLRDDPVESGRELAAAGDVLPSDAWRGGNRAMDRGVSVISRENKELDDLRRAIAASEEDLSVGGIVHDEPVYSVRVIPLRRKGWKGSPGAKGNNVDALDERELVQPAVVIGENEGDSWDELFQELEAQGWVPVEGWSEGEDEDELASIAESWIMANDGGESW